MHYVSCSCWPGAISIQSVGTHYMEFVFLHPVGYAGHVVHFGASGVRNVDAILSWSGGPGAISIKSALGHITPNLCFASGRICGSRSAS
jgi:hypothetical protein